MLFFFIDWLKWLCLNMFGLFYTCVVWSTLSSYYYFNCIYVSYFFHTRLCVVSFIWKWTLEDENWSCSINLRSSKHKSLIVQLLRVTPLLIIFSSKVLGWSQVLFLLVVFSHNFSYNIILQLSLPTQLRMSSCLIFSEKNYGTAGRDHFCLHWRVSNCSLKFFFLTKLYFH